MSKLKPVSRRVLIKKLKILGFEGLFSGGKHHFMVKQNVVLRIPNPHKDLISVDLLSRLLKQANISKEKWLDAK